MKKKIAALGLTLAMLTGMLPLQAWAAPEGASTKHSQNEADGIELTKSAYWVNEYRQNAEIELTVKGKDHETSQTEPANIVLVLDISQSMIWPHGKMPCLGQHNPVTSFGSTPIYECSITHTKVTEPDPAKHLVSGFDVTKEYAATFMESLAKSGGKLQVLPILFSDSAAPYMATPFEPYRFTNDYTELAKRIRDIPASIIEGETNYSAALEEARKYLRLANQNHPTKVVFLSDGVPMIGYEGVAQAEALKNTVTGGRNVELYTIGFNLARNSEFDNNLHGSEYTAEKFLQKITSTPLDKFSFFAENADSLKLVFEQIANSITGVVPAGRDITLTDVVAAPFEIDRSRWAELPEGVSVDGQKVTWKISATIQAGQSLIIPIRVKDSAPASFGLSDTNVSAELTYTNYLDASASMTVDSPQLDRKGAEPMRSLAMQKSAVIAKDGDHSTLRPGDRIDYTLTVQNTGEADETGVLVTDTLFGHGAADIKVDGAAKALNADNKLDLGTVAAGQTVTVTYSYHVTEAKENQTIKNAATAASNEGTTATDGHETDKVEGKQALKIYYAVEQVSGDTTQFITQNKDKPYLALSGYPGETVSRAEVEAAIAEAIAQNYDGAADGSIDRAAREIVGLGDSFTFEGKSSTLTVKDSLVRHTLTYQPNGGSLQPGDKAKGETQGDGSIVFTLPHGATPSVWFGDNANGTLDVKTAGGSSSFNGWSPAPDHTKPVTADLTFAAQWRDSGALRYQVELYIEGQDTPIDTRDDFTLSMADGKHTLTLDGDALLADAQSKGKLTEGYRFLRYNDDVSERVHTFVLDNNGMNTIRAYAAPYDLRVWHVYGGTRLFDKAQSKPVVSEPAKATADAAVFNNSRIIYDRTGVAIDGVADTATYTSVVDIPVGRRYEVTFGYRTRSSGGGTPDIDITEPEIPLAPGLDGDDHFAYVIGYPDGTIRPQNNIDRQEVATIFFRLLTEDSRNEAWSTANTFRDVPAALWSNTAVSTMSNADILKGDPDGRFRPNDPITRAEFASIAARFDSALYVGEPKFTDISGHWAANDINRAAQKGWVQGDPDGRFRPNDFITRAEAMTLVNNVLDRRVKAEGLLGDMTVWPDNKTSDWFYTAVQEATNSHDYDRENTLAFETWTAIKPAKDWNALERA